MKPWFSTAFYNLNLKWNNIRCLLYMPYRNEDVLLFSKRFQKYIHSTDRDFSRQESNYEWKDWYTTGKPTTKIISLWFLLQSWTWSIFSFATVLLLSSILRGTRTWPAEFHLHLFCIDSFFFVACAVSGLQCIYWCYIRK